MREAWRPMSRGPRRSGYNPASMTNDEREHMLSTVGQAHAGLSEVALTLRLGRAAEYTDAPNRDPGRAGGLRSQARAAAALGAGCGTDHHGESRWPPWCAEGHERDVRMLTADAGAAAMGGAVALESCRAGRRSPCSRISARGQRDQPERR